LRDNQNAALVQRALANQAADDGLFESRAEFVTCRIVVPESWPVALTVKGCDYEYEGDLAEFTRKLHYGIRGTGGMTHNDPDGQPASDYGGHVTLHTSGGRDAYLPLPIIPAK
jgi:hypothetical protein